MNSMQIELIGDKLMVLPDEVSKKTEKGIVIPDNALPVACTGTIVAVSHEIDAKDKDGNLAFRVGRRVQYHAGTGFPVKLEEKLYLMFETPEIHFFL